MNISLKSVAIAAALLVSNTVIASPTTVIATENFQQDSVGLIAGQNGGSGWSSAWKSNGGAPTVISTAGDNALQFQSDATSAAFRSLNSTVTQDVTIRFAFQYNGAVLGNNDFLALWFGTSDGPNIGLKANCGDGKNGCVDDAFSRTNVNGNATPLTNSDLVAGQNYVFFGHLYKGAGSTTYNHFDAWLNPTSDELLNWTTPDAQASSAAGTGIGSFNQIGFRTANITGSNVNVVVDDIQLSVVPEPASIALMGASLLAMAGLRRRRQK